jgi:hypothetical protein
MYINQDFSRRMDGLKPLVYVDVEDAELAQYSALAEAVAAGGRVPLVLVGDDVVSPAAISSYWIEDQLDKLEAVAVGAGEGGRD